MSSCGMEQGLCIGKERDLRWRRDRNRAVLAVFLSLPPVSLRALQGTIVRCIERAMARAVTYLCLNRLHFQ